MKTNSTRPKYFKAKKKKRFKIGFYIHLCFYIICVPGMIFSSTYADLNNGQKLPVWILIATITVWSITLFIQASKIFGLNILFKKSWEDRKVNEQLMAEETTMWQ